LQTGSYLAREDYRDGLIRVWQLVPDVWYGARDTGRRDGKFAVWEYKFSSRDRCDKFAAEQFVESYNGQMRGIVQHGGIPTPPAQ